MVRCFGKAEKEFLNMMARLTSSLGLGEVSGKVWGALLLAGPLTQDEISKLTGYSTGMVSSTLSLLERWGFITRVGKRGKKRVYAASRTVIEMMEGFLLYMLEKRLLPLISHIRENLEEFREETRENAVKLLEEYELARHILASVVEMMSRMRQLAVAKTAD